jgi:hypothetical protein
VTLTQKALRTVYVCESCHNPPVKGSVGRVLADSDAMENIAEKFDRKTYGILEKLA